jgi:hypothetical protein
MSVLLKLTKVRVNAISAESYHVDFHLELSCNAIEPRENAPLKVSLSQLLRFHGICHDDLLALNQEIGGFCSEGLFCDHCVAHALFSKAMVSSQD